MELRSIIARKFVLKQTNFVHKIVITSSYQFVLIIALSLVYKKTRKKKITGTSERTRESERQDESRARTRPRVLTASTQTNLKASHNG